MSGWRAPVVDGRIRLIGQAAGEDRFRQIEINALVQQVIVTDDRGKAAAALTSRWPALTAEEVLDSPFVLIGSTAQIIADLIARRQRWGISNYTIPEAAIDAFAPVVTSLAGR